MYSWAFFWPILTSDVIQTYSECRYFWWVDFSNNLSQDVICYWKLYSWPLLCLIKTKRNITFIPQKICKYCNWFGERIVLITRSIKNISRLISKLSRMLRYFSGNLFVSKFVFVYAFLSVLLLLFCKPKMFFFLTFRRGNCSNYFTKRWPTSVHYLGLS